MSQIRRKPDCHEGCWRMQRTNTARKSWSRCPRLDYVHMPMHIPHMAMTLEIWSALPHSGLIRQFFVCKQHLGQLLPELLPSVSLFFWGWVCIVSWCFPSHSSLSPPPIFLEYVPWFRIAGSAPLLSELPGSRFESFLFVAYMLFWPTEWQGFP